jgi:hypothetical protein
MDVELLGADRLGNGFVLDTETLLGTRAVVVDILPVEAVADFLGNLAADRQQNLVVAVGLDIEVARSLLGILLDIPEVGRSDILVVHFDNLEADRFDIPEPDSQAGFENRLDALVHPYVGSLPLASEPLALCHCQFAPVHIYWVDGDGDDVTLLP